VHEAPLFGFPLDPPVPALHMYLSPYALCASSRRKPDRGAQQPAEVGPADVARDPQRLDDPVGHGVGQPGLEPVEALPEPARRAVVLGERHERHERHERLAQLDGSAVAELAERLGQREPRTDRRAKSAPPARPAGTSAAPSKQGNRQRQPARAPINQVEEFPICQVEPDFDAQQHCEDEQQHHHSIVIGEAP
jgi:hypothetical protein